MKKKSGVKEYSSPAWEMSLIDRMKLPKCMPILAIQLEIPDLCAADGLKKSVSQKTKPKTKGKRSLSYAQNIAIDPRQLQLAFFEA
ncbi:hypothetical protein ACHAC9_08075 [Massilia sp. CMS3.1]|uniref:hypothetical protein n=1 Tax=Massilia sp. CMS3.1 TaxID=3373083 RepID=UPI003EE5CD16